MTAVAARPRRLIDEFELGLDAPISAVRNCAWTLAIQQCTNYAVWLNET
jgi:hypothetical protein